MIRQCQIGNQVMVYSAIMSQKSKLGVVMDVDLENI
jgi:hypothetical protein